MSSSRIAILFVSFLYLFILVLDRNKSNTDAQKCYSNCISSSSSLVSTSDSSKTSLSSSISLNSIPDCEIASWIQLCFSSESLPSGSSLTAIEKSHLSPQELVKCFRDPVNYFRRQFSSLGVENKVEDKTILKKELKTKLKTKKQKQQEREQELHAQELRKLLRANITKAVETDTKPLRISIGSNGVCKDGWICTDKDSLDLFRIEDWENAFRTVSGELAGEVSGVSDNRRILVNNIFAEHVLEHFSPDQTEMLIASAFLNLKPGGVFRVAVPDGYQPNEKRQLDIRSGKVQQLGGAFAHRTVWHVDSLPALFRKFGFKVKMREWYSLEGEFMTSLGDQTENKLAALEGKILEGKSRSGSDSGSDKDDKESGTENEDPEDPYKDEELYGIVRRSNKHDERNTDGMRQSQRITSLWFDAIRPVECKAR